MNIDAFYQSRSGDWRELADLMNSARGRLSRLNRDSIVRFATLYRSTCADLAFARREYAGDAIHYSLETMVARCSSMMYEHRAIDKRKVLYFITTGAFASIAQRPRLLFASFLLMMVPWVASSFYAVANPENAHGLAPAGVESVIERPSADFQLSPDEKAQASSEILTNNIRISFFAFVGGITAGVVTIITMIYNGVALGTTFGLTVEAGNGGVLWGFVFPHGFLEISCLIVAGAAGLRVGWALVSPGFRTRARALREEGRQALASALVVAVSLFLCGIVEGTISTSGVSAPVGITIGLSLFSIFWGLVIQGGIRDAKRERVKN
ncbi:MAG TPA: stage II sporulation protein M [Acidimicrobiia bacterium]|nr:stage II sporulation protein M [Acidimicrobiia bacterium]